MSNKPTLAVWFSRGAASAVAAKICVSEYSQSFEVRLLSNPILEEDSDSYRFQGDVANWVGQEIEVVGSDRFPSGSIEEVWAAEGAMSFATGYAPCTDWLKKRCRQSWEAENFFNFRGDNALVLGFTADEKDRHDRFVLTERENLLPVLIDRGITKFDCFRMVAEAGIELPRMYQLGYANNNCPGCVKATSPTYWNRVRQTHPEVFEKRALQSRRMGVRLVRVKGERLFLDELDPSAVGRPMASENMSCSAFCAE